MSQFYQVACQATYNGTQCINLLWFIRDVAAAPTTTELQAVHNEVVNGHVSLMQQIQVSSYVYNLITVRGFDDTFNPSPPLPLITAVSLAGLDTNPAPPPMYVGIFGFRTNPIRSSPLGRAVRRGYLAFSGLGEQNYEPDGSLAASFRNLASVTNLRTWHTTGHNSDPGLGPIPIVPIRVSPPLPATTPPAPPASPNRGYGIILQAQFAVAASSRRSRKLGRGA